MYLIIINFKQFSSIFYRNFFDEIKFALPVPRREPTLVLPLVPHVGVSREPDDFRSECDAVVVVVTLSNPTFVTHRDAVSSNLFA